MRSYPVKENQIGSAVSEILRYKQTNIVLLCIIDDQCSISKSLSWIIMPLIKKEKWKEKSKLFSLCVQIKALELSARNPFPFCPPPFCG